MRSSRSSSRFDRDALRSEPLQTFSTALWNALVPESGECVSVQGELVRANVRLQDDYFRNGSNYYWELDSGSAASVYDAEQQKESYYGGMLLFLLDTLIANHNAALDPEDVAYFDDVRRLLGPDWIRHHRICALGEKCDDGSASAAETRELHELEEASPVLDWEDLFDRAELCIANWCIANPELVDRQGRAVEEGGVLRIEHIFEPAATGAKVEVFVERLADDEWREVASLRASLRMDLVHVLRKDGSLLDRGIPHDLSTDVAQALADLGEEVGEQSWATLQELRRLPFEQVVMVDRRLLGPILWRERLEPGTPGREQGSRVEDDTPARVARFGARLVSNEEMDRYVKSDKFAAETAGLTDGECKVFTIAEHSRNIADAVGFARTLEAMGKAGSPAAVRIVWAIGP